MFGLISIAISASEAMEEATARQYREKSIWWIKNNRGSLDQLINELTYVTAVVNRHEIPVWSTRIKFIPDTFTMKKTYQCWYREIRNDSVLMVAECHMLIPNAINTSTRTKIFPFIFYSALNKQTGNYEVRTRVQPDLENARIAGMYGTRFFEALKELQLKKNVVMEEKRSFWSRLFEY